MKTAVVFGMRSGSSVVSAILNKWGIDMGTEFRGPDSNNETGYYEDAQILRAVTSIIGNRFEREGPIKIIGIEQLVQFRELIKDKSKELWGFKAPGACFMTEVIDAVVPDPHYVLCMRNPHSMSASLEKIKTHDLPKNFRHLDYCKLFQKVMMEQTFRKNRIVIEYENLIEDPVITLMKLRHFLKLDIKDDLFQEGVKVVRPELQHHAY